MLHALTVQSHLAGVPERNAELARWDLLEAITKWAEKNLNRSVAPELAGLTIRRMVVKATAARAIMQAAREENVDLIMMPCGGPTFYDFLQSSATAQLEPAVGCPVWTDAKGPESPVEKFAIRRILCAVEFNSNDHRAVSWASRLAAEFGARLTLAHVTASVGDRAALTSIRNGNRRSSVTRLSRLQIFRKMPGSSPTYSSAVATFLLC